MNFKMIVQYDGSRYKGWQVQKSTDATIQGKLQDVLLKLTGEPVEVIGSGRTDAGVHALGQCANFHIPAKTLRSIFDSTDHEKELLYYFNRYLPDDIAVLSVEEADERFHSRYNTKIKHYRYRIHTSIIPDVFERKYTCRYIERPLDIERMRAAAAEMIGTHDFMAFCTLGKLKKSTVRTVTEINIERIGSEIRIDVFGTGFLRNMIRIMVGTMMEVGAGSRTPEDVREMIESLDRTKAGYTAPPQGLSLVEVIY